MATPALAICNLTKRYGETIAVDDISLQIDQGEFFGFLGPNGAGKTTTINCVTGISNLDEGSIKVFGIDVVKEYREARKCIGLSPQEFNIDIFASTRSILDYVAGYYGMQKAKRKERIEELLDRLDLTDHADKAFRELSGGFKRRVTLARAMVHDPMLLILDEPTAALDVESRQELWKYLREINKNGKTILLTSHYLEEIEILCNRIAIIHKGKIVAIGDKKDFISDDKTLECTYLEITKK